MSDTGTGNGNVVVNRAMSLDGFIAGPGHAMDWVLGYVAPDELGIRPRSRDRAGRCFLLLTGRS
jgi:hypothetical protein